MLYSTGSGVRRVHVVLSWLRMKLFVCVHVCILYRHDCLLAFAMFMSMSVDLRVMSYAYVVSFTAACGVGMSDVYMLNSVCDITPPCGMPVLNWRCDDVLFLNVV